MSDVDHGDGPTPVDLAPELPQRAFAPHPDHVGMITRKRIDRAAFNRGTLARHESSTPPARPVG